MNWFQAHSYIPAWLSPPIALIALVINNFKKSGRPVNWSMVVIYTAFLTCLATYVTPGMDIGVRLGTGTVGGLTCPPEISPVEM